MKQNDQKLSTCLWFDNNAEEAVDFYASIFKDNLQRGDILRWGDVGNSPKGSVLTTEFNLYGQEYIALNGGPQVTFNMAVSICINCDTQEEVDRLWEQLSEGGEKSMCGWLTDKFGLWWQVTPRSLPKMLMDKNEKKANATMKAMMEMRKLDIKQLQEAYDNA